jgi:hypothetical protein
MQLPPSSSLFASFSYHSQIPSSSSSSRLYVPFNISQDPFKIWPEEILLLRGRRAVESQNIRGANRQSRNPVLVAQLDNTGTEITRRKTLVSKKVSSEADDVRGRHGGSRDDVGSTVVPCGEN